MMQLPPGRSWDIGLAMRLPYCEEAQATWRSPTQAFQPTAAAEVPARQPASTVRRLSKKIPRQNTEIAPWLLLMTYDEM